jgi:quercetin dioxygenase-like cupin family protein
MKITKINHCLEIKTNELPGVTKQIPIGRDVGSSEIIMRLFILDPGAATPYHQHGFPHLIKIESGNGVLIDKEAKEHQISVGNYIYIGDNEPHGFKNNGNEPFKFLCIVPSRGEA